MALGLMVKERTQKEPRKWTKMRLFVSYMTNLGLI